MSEDMKNEIRKFISTKFIVAEEITNDLPLTESGIIDSMGIITLITYIEDTHNIEVDDDEINQKNFGSVDRITAFIQSKLA